MHSSFTEAITLQQLMLAVRPADLKSLPAHEHIATRFHLHLDVFNPIQSLSEASHDLEKYHNAKDPRFIHSICQSQEAALRSAGHSIHGA
jgi:hypothetical protein